MIEAPVRKIAVWVPFTQDTLDDVAEMRAAMSEMWRTIELANRGFLGLVRCDRCRRRTRCVYALPGRRSRLYGRTCYAKVA